MRLTPRIQITHQCYISPDNYCLLLLGNDIFNKEMVETIAQNETFGCYVLRHGNQIDILPYKLLSVEERRKREVAYEQEKYESEYRKNQKKDKEIEARKQPSRDEASSSKTSSYEKASELILASKMAQRAIDATRSPEVPSTLSAAVMEENRKNHSREIDKYDQEDHDRRIAK